MNNTWTDEEVEFLKENYALLGSGATAKALGKTDEAVRQKASKLKIVGRRLTIAERHREVGKKPCSKCGIEKPLEEFHQAKKYAYGRNAWCRECISEYNKQRRRSNPEVVERERISHQKTRIEVMLRYCPDGVLRCACCGESEPKFLALDHVNGGGNEHRRQIGRAPTSLWLWLKKNDYPPGFQVLCHNCNMAKGFYGICPHQLSKSKDD